MTLRERLLAGGMVDTHYHIGPELMPRRYDVRTLADEIVPLGMTVVLKNHTYPTTPLAALARQHFGASILGGIVLNRFVGGMNPDAVFGAASGNHADVSHGGTDPTFVVWMPTVHAESHLRCLGHAFDHRWWGACCSLHEVEPHEEPVRIFADPGALNATLDAIASTGARLATGHLHADEIMRLVPMALTRGISVILTHPHYPSVDLSDAQLVELTADKRVFIEHCLAIHTIEEVPLERFVATIRATGVGQTILATDFGQVQSETAADGEPHFARLLAQWLPEDDLVTMMTVNPRRALGLA